MLSLLVTYQNKSFYWSHILLAKNFDDTGDLQYINEGWPVLHRYLENCMKICMTDHKCCFIQKLCVT